MVRNRQFFTFFILRNVLLFIRADGGEVILELAGAAGSDDDAGDALLLENPLEGFLGEGVAGGLCLVVPLAELLKQFGGKHVGTQELGLCHAAVLGNVADHTFGRRMAVEIAIGEEALCEGTEGDEADAVVVTVLHRAVVNGLMVEHVQLVLEDKQGHIATAEIFIGEFQCFEWPA